jgi:uncharacterized membrane protein
MSAAHIHLLFNHFPIVGLLIALLIFIVGLTRKNETLKVTGLVTIVGVALLTLPAFFSGEGAEEVVERLPGISHDLIHKHEEKAELAFIFMIITGVVALTVLVMRWRKMTVPGLLLYAVLILGSVTFGMMIPVGNSGGHINHPELRGDTSPNIEIYRDDDDID